MIYEVCRIYRIQNKHWICSEYIYIYAYICVSEFTKGVGLLVCMSLQNDVFLPKESHHPWAHERKMTSDDIPSSKSENSQPRIALPMAHLSLGNLFFNLEIDQVFTKWIIKWITDPLKLPQQTTWKKKTLFELLPDGVSWIWGFFVASRIQTAGSMVPWGSMVKRSRQDAWLGYSEHLLAL